MKKKIFIIVVLLLSLHIKVNADTTTKRCSKYPNGDIDIVWSGKKQTVGTTNITHCTYSATKDSSKRPHYAASMEECNRKRYENCSGTCVETSKGSNCTGGKSCSSCEKVGSPVDCSTTTVTVNKKSSSSSRSKFFSNMLPITKVARFLLEDEKYGGNSKSNNTSSFFDNLKSKNNLTVNQIITETYDRITRCVFNYAYYENVLKLDTCGVKGTAEVKAAEYLIDSGNTEYNGDVVYCLQPGAKGPDTPQRYTLVNTFDISNCKDSLHLKNGKNDVRCGLAHILYQTVNAPNDSGMYTSNNKYSYGSITYALRLWMAEYAEKYGASDDGLGSKNNYGIEFDELEWVPDPSDKNNDYYRNTAKKIVDSIKNNKSYPLNSSETGILTCNSSNCGLKDAITLFTSAYNAAFVDTSKYLNGADFSVEVPVFKNYQTSRDGGTMTVEIPESLRTRKDLKIECTEEEYKYAMEHPNEKHVCDIQIRIYDESGKEITKDVVKSGYCTKEMCKVETTATKTCQEVTDPYGIRKLTIKIYVLNWNRNNGYVRFYTHTNNPQNYQKMITFAFNLEKCEEELGVPESVIETTTHIECPCDEDVRCNDLDTKANLPNKCSSNSDYTTGNSTDPNMNCILNACYTFDKNKYDNTQKLNADPNVCHIYCRNEIELYLPTKASTYAGMQFQFDLAKVLKDKNIIKNTVADKQSSIPKLSGILIHKKQCTSEINYSGWKEEYDKKLANMEKAYTAGNNNSYNTLKQEVSQWIYKLQNCNLYSKNEIVDPYGVSRNATTNGTSKDYLVAQNICTNSKDCFELNVSYEDNTYGQETTLGKISENISLNSPSTYYCKDTASTKCYKYEKNKAVEINSNNYNSNSLTTINYKDCENGNCSNKTIKLPNNDYATFIIKSETDFYQSKKYQTDVLSGAVTEGDGSESNKGPIADNSYPISNGTKTGSYDINYRLTNIKVNNKNDYAYSCKYDVYNTTILYDCNVNGSDGNYDLSKCKNTCYEVKDGVPIINDSCMTYEKTNNKQYGFVFRNVNLSELFPNAIINADGISTRSVPVNWSFKATEIQEIQKTSSDIFTNNKYLEYRFVLTPDTIKDIKNYNKEQSSKGGYTNFTLYNCEKVANGNVYEFRNCKSSFLTREIKGYKGIQVSGSKAGAN